MKKAIILTIVFILLAGTVFISAKNINKIKFNIKDDFVKIKNNQLIPLYDSIVCTFKGKLKNPNACLHNGKFKWKDIKDSNLFFETSEKVIKFSNNP